MQAWLKDFGDGRNILAEDGFECATIQESGDFLELGHRHYGYLGPRVTWSDYLSLGRSERCGFGI